MKNFLLALCLSLLSTVATAQTEWVGQVAPSFSLPDQHGKARALSEYKGRWVALYFYPKNDTPGCTEEAKAFRDLYPTLKQNNIDVVGVSLDDVASHKAFAKKLDLPFTLLADSDQKLARHFNVLRGFGPITHAKRETFLIDPNGNVVYHYKSVNAAEHAKQVLGDVKRLSHESNK